LSLDPLRVRVEFQVISPGPLQYFILFGSPGECAPKECAAPPGWSCNLPRYNSNGYFYFPMNYLPKGQGAGPFTIVVGTLPCSYKASYYQDGLPEWFAEEPVTFTPMAIVPTLQSTWGAMKAHYR